MELKTGDASNAILAGITYYNLGDQAVNVFFVLSGLMVSASLERSTSYVRFVVSRLLRIFPGLIVCTALLALIAGPLLSSLPAENYFQSRVVFDFIMKTLLSLSGSGTLPGVFSDTAHLTFVNAPVWTLKYEIACYFILVGLSLAGIFGNRKALLWVTLTSWLAILIYFVWLPDGRLATIPAQVARFWLCFSAGMLAYRLRQFIPINVVLAVVAIALWYVSWHTVVERFVSPLAAGYFALWLGAVPTGRMRDMANRYDLSYGAYIFGWPITQIFVRAWPTASIAETLSVVSLLSALAAMLSWLVVERPAMRFGRAKLGRRPDSPTVRV